MEFTICSSCDGRGIILDKECNNPDCYEGLIKSYEEIIEEIEKDKNGISAK